MPKSRKKERWEVIYRHFYPKISRSPNETNGDKSDPNKGWQGFVGHIKKWVACEKERKSTFLMLLKMNFYLFLVEYSNQSSNQSPK